MLLVQTLVQLLQPGHHICIEVTPDGLLHDHVIAVVQIDKVHNDGELNFKVVQLAFVHQLDQLQLHVHGHVQEIELGDPDEQRFVFGAVETLGLEVALQQLQFITWEHSHHKLDWFVVKLEGQLAFVVQTYQLLEAVILLQLVQWGLVTSNHQLAHQVTTDQHTFILAQSQFGKNFQLTV